MKHKWRAVALCLLASLCAWYLWSPVVGSIVIILGLISLYYYKLLLQGFFIAVGGFGLYALIETSMTSLKVGLVILLITVLFALIGSLFEKYVYGAFVTKKAVHHHVFVDFDEKSLPHCFETLEFQEIPQYFEEVKKRYKHLAKVYHPDAGGNKEAFIELHEAYQLCKTHYQ